MELSAVRPSLPHKDSVKLRVFEYPKGVSNLLQAPSQESASWGALFPEPWEVQDPVEGIAWQMT